MRKPLIAGNWKMNKTLAEGVRLVQDLSYLVEDVEDVDIVVCPPFTILKGISTLIEYDKPNIKLGAQNMHWEQEGAYTGEISPLMLKDLNVEFVILGHSERRRYFFETDEIINRKVKAAFKFKISPILCLGESLEEREAGKTFEVVQNQLFKALEGVSQEEVKHLIIAYEPVWAIGTGKSAFPEDANDTIRHIRALIGSKFTPEIAKNQLVLYGGSVTPENIAEFMVEPDIDGALVGGASLDAVSFSRIIKFRG